MMSAVVAESGDMESSRTFLPSELTANPSVILQAAQMPDHAATLGHFTQVLCNLEIERLCQAICSTMLCEWVVG
jgi:hypothetical protein